MFFLISPFIKVSEFSTITPDFLIKENVFVFHTVGCLLLKKIKFSLNSGILENNDSYERVLNSDIRTFF